MHRKIIDKITDIQEDVQEVKDAKLKHHLKTELASLQVLVQHGIKREFSYFKHVSLTIAGATGVILFWRGVYEITSQNHFLKDPGLSLVTGLIILALTGLLSREFLTVPAKDQQKYTN